MRPQTSPSCRRRIGSTAACGMCAATRSNSPGKRSCATSWCIRGGGVLALDDDDRVLLIRQYRHPVGWYLFEPPAGLLDKPGEDPLLAAQRELAEEAGYQAEEWFVLVDFLNSPGGSSETFPLLPGAGLSPIDGGRLFTGEAEETDLPRAWVPLDAARDAVLADTCRIRPPSPGCWRRGWVEPADGNPLRPPTARGRSGMRWWQADESGVSHVDRGPARSQAAGVSGGDHSGWGTGVRAPWP